MYYYIYKTTNLVNGKMYIGQHTTNNLDDGYLGSGKLILRAIKKYGKENFNKEILTFAANEKELDNLEKEYIDKFNAIEDEHYYNLTEGGIGRHGFKWSEEHKIKMSFILKELYSTGKKIPVNKGVPLSAETKQKMSLAFKQRKQNGLFVSPGLGKFGDKNPMYGKHHSEEIKKAQSIKMKENMKNPEFREKIYTEERLKKISKTRKEKFAKGEYFIPNRTGSNNPMFGKFEDKSPRYKVELSLEQKNQISKSRKKAYETGKIKKPTTFPKSVSVICIETNIVYKSIKKAAKDNGCHDYQIRDCCEGKRETANKLHWSYASQADTVPSK